MPSGRLAVAHDESRARQESFYIDGVTITYDRTQANGAAATMIGKAVGFSADDTVELVADAEPIIGKLLNVEADGVCAVQINGYTTLPGGTAATLTRGRRAIGAVLVAARGYIRVVNTAAAAELNGAGPIIWNNADTTNVGVDFR